MLLDDVLRVGQRGLLSLLRHQEGHQVLRAHEARRFGVRPVDDVDLLPVGQQVVEAFYLLPGQVSRFGFVALLYGGNDKNNFKTLSCAQVVHHDIYSGFRRVGILQRARRAPP